MRNDMFPFVSLLWWEVQIKKRRKVYSVESYYDPDLDEKFTVRILHPGEYVLYCEGRRALIAKIHINPSARTTIIFVDSLTRWDNGRKLIPKDRKKVLLRIQQALRKRGTIGSQSSSVILREQTEYT